MESEFYLQARREWDDRYGDLVLGKRNWQIALGGLMLLSLILALGIVWMSARTKVIPFVVEVHKLGYSITIPTALQFEQRRLVRSSPSGVQYHGVKVGDSASGCDPARPVREALSWIGRFDIVAAQQIIRTVRQVNR